MGEPQQVPPAGGPDVPAHPGEDPGAGDEQPGHLDRLAVPPERSQTAGQGTRTDAGV